MKFFIINLTDLNYKVVDYEGKLLYSLLSYNDSY